MAKVKTKMGTTVRKDGVHTQKRHYSFLRDREREEYVVVDRTKQPIGKIREDKKIQTQPFTFKDGVTKKIKKAWAFFFNGKVVKIPVLKKDGTWEMTMYHRTLDLAKTRLKKVEPELAKGEIKFARLPAMKTKIVKKKVASRKIA